MDVGLDRAYGQAERGGDLVVGQVLQKAQRQHEPVFLRQSVQLRVQERHLLPDLDKLGLGRGRCGQCFVQRFSLE